MTAPQIIMALMLVSSTISLTFSNLRTCRHILRRNPTLVYIVGPTMHYALLAAIMYWGGFW